MQIKLKRARLAFCNSIWRGKAEQYQGKGPHRHSATFLVETDGENYKTIQAAISAVAEEKWGKKAKAFVDSIRGNSNKFCFQDGATKPDYDGFEGMFSLSGHRKSNDGPPLILTPRKHEGQFLEIDEAGNAWPIGKVDKVEGGPTETDFKVTAPYGGCYVNATVDIYAQDGDFSGIRCGLVTIQFAADGDSFGGASRATPDGMEEEPLSEGADAEDLV